MTEESLLISKKIAAQEMHRQITKTKQLSLISIVGILLTLMITVFSVMIASIISFIIIGILCYFLAKDQKFLKYIEQKYNINPKSQIINPK